LMQNVESDGDVAKQAWRARCTVPKAHHRTTGEGNPRVKGVDMAQRCQHCLQLGTPGMMPWKHRLPIRRRKQHMARQGLATVVKVDLEGWVDSSSDAGHWPQRR
jgi:hypothetical protein